MRSRVVGVSPLATHRRRRPLVLMVRFLVLPRTGGPGHEQPVVAFSQFAPEPSLSLLRVLERSEMIRAIEADECSSAGHRANLMSICEPPGRNYRLVGWGLLEHTAP